MKKLLSIFVFLSLFGCNAADLKENFIVGLSNTLSISLECNAPKEIENDVRWLFGETTSGVNFQSIEIEKFNPSLCKTITIGLIEIALDKGVPSHWECKKDKAHLILTEVANTICDNYAQMISNESFYKL